MDKEMLEILMRLETKIDMVNKKLDKVGEMDPVRNELLKRIDEIREDVSSKKIVRRQVLAK